MSTLLQGLNGLEPWLSNSFEDCWSAAAALATGIAQASWQGPAAATFWSELDRPHQQLSDAQQALDKLLTEVRNTIAGLVSALREVARIEEEARGWFSREEHALLVGVMPPWLHWMWHPATFPASGDPQWLEVGDYLRARGVPI